MSDLVHGICRRCSRRRYLSAQNRLCGRCDAWCQEKIVLGTVRALGLAA